MIKSGAQVLPHFVRGGKALDRNDRTGEEQRHPYFTHSGSRGLNHAGYPQEISLEKVGVLCFLLLTIYTVHLCTVVVQYYHEHQLRLCQSIQVQSYKSIWQECVPCRRREPQRNYHVRAAAACCPSLPDALRGRLFVAEERMGKAKLLILYCYHYCE